MTQSYCQVTPIAETNTDTPLTGSQQSVSNGAEGTSSIEQNTLSLTSASMNERLDATVQGILERPSGSPLENIRPLELLKLIKDEDDPELKRYMKRLFRKHFPEFVCTFPGCNKSYKHRQTLFKHRLTAHYKCKSMAEYRRQQREKSKATEAKPFPS